MTELMMEVQLKMERMDGLDGEDGDDGTDDVVAVESTCAVV